eukprot:CAMPEP_0171633822 /NCGR_PEP_ID=MMETSP0990-20121206/25489_1 /TAXON_ID=483369 /ORGANISM="non described non described, Strain CCMP2098" /LENGTH=215 /DNA_ID=CAMNT_0012204727 /DNA_START=78 /DNA_END=727 /DNA_ORIENTATION=+
MKMRYDADLGGVIMAFRRVALREPSGQVNSDARYSHSTSIRPAVWADTAGFYIGGLAYNLSLLAYENFNATIKIDKARFSAQDSEWKEKSGTSEPLKAGTIVKFMVTGMHHASGLLSLDGDVVNASKSDVPSSQTQISDAHKSEHSSKKRPRNVLETSEETSSESTSIETKKKSAKKEKKHKKEKKARSKHLDSRLDASTRRLSAHKDPTSLKQK